MKLCFIDSGVGGLSVYKAFIKECRSHIIDLEVIYFADFAHAPYGKRDKKEITELMLSNVRKLYKKFACTFFVLACNTATACAISALRKEFPHFVFVGTEPNVTQAKHSDGNVLVMSTSATYFYSSLLQKYRADKSVYFLPLGGLSAEIDKHCDNLERLKKLVYPKLLPYKNLGIKSVVLGCTNYTYLRSAITAVLGDVEFFDSTNGVTRRIFDCLAKTHSAPT